MSISRFELIDVKASLYNTYKVKLTFKNGEERSLIERAVSFEVPGATFSAAYKSGHWNGRKCFLTERDYLAAGLFKMLFPKHPLLYTESNLDYSDIPLYRTGNFERRQYQLDAINAIFSHHRLLIKSATGSGKTLIASASITRHLEENENNRVLFITYDTNILNQTKKNLTKKYGLTVGVYGGGEHNLRERITIATMQSLQRLHKPEQVLADITMVIVDESHHSRSKTSRAILTKLYGCRYFIGLTATPPASDTLEYHELVSVIGPVLYEYSLQKSTDDGNTVPVKCFFVKVPLDKSMERIINRRYYKLIWDEGICLNKTRNTLIANICKSIDTTMNAPTLINVDRVEHGAELYTELKKNVKVLCSFGADNAIQREEKRKYLMQNEVSVLISSIQKEGVDFDISPVIAINATGRKGVVNVAQFLGRIVRKNEKFGSFRAYIDFLDCRSHDKLDEHSLARLQTCRDTGSDVVIVENINELLLALALHYRKCLG